jgi:cobalt-precorrin 5A hydrolase/precorrin-3B C17-methyltransferase
LVYHPKNVAIAITHPDVTLNSVQTLLANADIASAAIAGIFAPITIAAYANIHTIADFYGVPMRFFREELAAEALALTATGRDGKLLNSLSQMAIAYDGRYAIAISPQPIDPNTIGQPQGRLAIIGTGPGSSQWMSPEVKEILKSATDLVGYKTYLDLVGSLAAGKQRHESDNREEIARATMALDLAATGRYVVVVSSGDPGIYAMATAVFEVLDHHHKPEWDSIDIHVAPGISAMQAAAAAVGAPLGHDFCTISLSDILKPWSIIEQRIAAAAEADFAIAFYNPVSKERTWQLADAKNILLRYRTPNTPVVLARNLGRPGQTVKVITLDQLAPDVADMRTVIIVGSSQTKIINRIDGSVSVYTPRRY